jgi:hypothetical protein
LDLAKSGYNHSMSGLYFSPSHAIFSFKHTYLYVKKQKLSLIAIN